MGRNDERKPIAIPRCQRRRTWAQALLLGVSDEEMRFAMSWGYEARGSRSTISLKADAVAEDVGRRKANAGDRSSDITNQNRQNSDCLIGTVYTRFGRLSPKWRTAEK